MVSPVSHHTSSQSPTVLPGLRPSVWCPTTPVHRAQQSCQDLGRQSGVPLHQQTIKAQSWTQQSCQGLDRQYGVPPQQQTVKAQSWTQQSCQGLDRQYGVPPHLYTEPSRPARA